MPKWTPPQEPEHAPTPPSGPVHIGRRAAPHVPPHVHIYAGLEHVSNQIEDVGSQVRDLILEVAELKRIVKEVAARTTSEEED
jgi:hypothetical protein